MASGPPRYGWRGDRENIVVVMYVLAIALLGIIENYKTNSAKFRGLCNLPNLSKSQDGFFVSKWSPVHRRLPEGD
jgi:hypothetical protein